MSDSETNLYAQLAADFDETHTLPSGLTYVTGEQVTRRLNEVLGFGAWSFEVKLFGYDEQSDSHWVLGRLEIPGDGIVREQFGSQKVNRLRAAPHQPVDYGFDLKGATTDAFKKCATGLGVALYLSQQRRWKPGACG